MLGPCDTAALHWKHCLYCDESPWPYQASKSCHMHTGSMANKKVLSRVAPNALVLSVKDVPCMANDRLRAATSNSVKLASNRAGAVKLF